MDIIRAEMLIKSKTVVLSYYFTAVCCLCCLLLVQYKVNICKVFVYTLLLVALIKKANTALGPLDQRTLDA